MTTRITYEYQLVNVEIAKFECKIRSGYSIVISRILKSKYKYCIQNMANGILESITRRVSTVHCTVMRHPRLFLA